MLIQDLGSLHNKNAVGPNKAMKYNKLLHFSFIDILIILIL